MRFGQGHCIVHRLPGSRWNRCFGATHSTNINGNEGERQPYVPHVVSEILDPDA